MENERGRVEEDYDRIKEIKQFDESKICVKGLVDSGITAIPRFFIHQPDSLPATATTAAAISASASVVPTVDLSGFDSDRRSIIVDQIRDASSKLGFFQVTNHGIPSEVIDRTIAAVKAFHELPVETKGVHYNRDSSRGVSFASNFDLYTSKAANWRDTMQIRWGPNLDISEIPEICRSELVEWDRQVERLAETLMEILSVGLGVEAGRLKALSCTEGKHVAAHYYPFCPQPDLTVGTTSHTDPGVLTVLLQDQIGGLQVKQGDQWVDIQPVPGALVINIGDILQIMSNEEYKSVEHRVLANHLSQPRISIAIFFNPSKKEDYYGPFPELISPEKPAIYRRFTLLEFLTRFVMKGLGESLINYFRLDKEMITN